MSNKENSDDDANNPKKNNKAKSADKFLDKEENVDKLVNAALRSHLLEYSTKKKNSKKTLSDISSIIKEQLNSFIILGYNYDGEQVSVVTATTQQEADSLCTLIHKFLMQNSPPGSV